MFATYSIQVPKEPPHRTRCSATNANDDTDMLAVLTLLKGVMERKETVEEKEQLLKEIICNIRVAVGLKIREDENATRCKTT